MQGDDDHLADVTIDESIAFEVEPIEGFEQAPLDPPSQPLTGESHAHLLAPPTCL